MEFVAHHGRETAYRVATGDASGPTALYVHGSGGTHRIWAHQYAPTGPAHPAVALDLSGHGESEDVDETETALEAYVEDVTAVADAVDADVLVGNSLGGAVALSAVLDDHLEPAALVLAGTGAKLAVHEDIRQLLAESFESAVDVLHGEDMLFHDVDPSIRERSMDEMSAVGQCVTRRDFLTCHYFDVRDRLGACSVPTLALVGEHDSLTPPSYHEYLAEELPNGRLEVIEAAAHLAMLERPEGFNEAVGGFVDDVVV